MRLRRFLERGEVVVGGRKKCIKISTKVFCLFLLLPLSFTGIMFVDVLEFLFRERESVTEYNYNYYCVALLLIQSLYTRAWQGGTVCGAKRPLHCEM